jgi:hypothetical protein
VIGVLHQGESGAPQISSESIEIGLDSLKRGRRRPTSISLRQPAAIPVVEDARDSGGTRKDFGSLGISSLPRFLGPAFSRGRGARGPSEDFIM